MCVRLLFLHSVILILLELSLITYFIFFLKGNVFIEESGKRMGRRGGHTSPARCAKSMLMIPLENNVLFTTCF